MVAKSGAGRGCRGPPLERAPVPGIRRCRRAATETAPRVDDEDEHGQCDAERADRRAEGGGGPARVGRIGVDASRHPQRAEVMLWKEREVEAREHEPEVEPAQP